MASFSKGYGYDIFNSCRLKDITSDKGDYWATEFANALKPEPEESFKEGVNYSIK